jgi:hypothetical protein
MTAQRNRSSSPIRQAFVAPDPIAASSVEWGELRSAATTDERERRAREPDRALQPDPTRSPRAPRGRPGACWQHTASAPSCVRLPRRKRDQSPQRWPHCLFPLYRYPERPGDSSRRDPHFACPPARQSFHPKPLRNQVREVRKVGSISHFVRFTFGYRVERVCVEREV